MSAPREPGTIAFALLARTAQGGIGATVMAVALLRLSPIEQGLFFTILSLGSLLQLGELGLSYAVLQTASHLVGRHETSALPGLSTWALRRNAQTMIGAALIVTAIGAGVLSARSGAIVWGGQWLTFVVAALMTLLLTPAVATREGGGRVHEVWRFRVWLEIASGIVLIAALAARLGLWSLPLAWVARGAATAWWLRSEPWPRGNDAHDAGTRQWHTEVWPFQWRMGLSSLSGYLIFNSFAPIVLWQQGPVVAGRFGLSVTVLNTLLQITTSWPLSQAARFGHLVGAGHFDELHRRFMRTLLLSTTFSVACAGAISAGLWIWTRSGLPYGDRFADPATTTILLATAVVHHIVMCVAVALRAERREPMLIPSVVGGLINVMVIWATARHGSVQTIAIGNIVCASAGIPIVAWLYQRRRAQWVVPTSAETLAT